MASFGMMNQAYFVGKNTLIDWINNFLEINIDKVECCANGAIYCNLWDALHPGSIPMSRVDFTVKHEYEYTKNWKLLQNGFQKAGIEKVIPVQRLIKARYQDNLEFLQWMYKYGRDTYNGDPDDPTYDAIGRRQKSKGGKDYTGSKNNNRNNKRNNGKENNRSNRPISASSRNQYRSSQSQQSQRGSISSMGLNNNNKSNQRELEALKNENQQLTESRNALQLKMGSLQQEHDELSNVAKDIEVERDFYFNKVVAIEQILKKEENQDTPLLKAIYELLYQTDEEQQNNNNNNNNIDQQMNNMNMNMNMNMNDI
eukprot:CAMPEP_0201575232 /NCGR_PEP_ID=MMETSP0190_2-20130828/20294_1 /ASSEMBLY_ACC=CAM_ASM_000263 /TAXON_ID=37353 /ORGANISM="Rosalina sp." /LENGTH=312 /DNA_ID=CAMNT_0048004587 /DNA_START=104 /DNA_END=1045 /DNA_ORIENTATION=-